MDELAKRFADLAEKYGPNVADAALGAARTEAYSTIIAGMMCLSVAGAMAYAGRFFWVKAHGADWDDDWVIASFIIWMVAFFTALPGLWQIIDPWTWTTIQHPELWIAKRAFKL